MQTGIYNYFLNGEPIGVTESFDIKLLTDNSKLTTSIRDAKPFNTKITVEAIEQNNKFQKCKISYQKVESKIEANYEFTENTFHVSRNVNNEIIQNETFDLPENYIFFPLMRCFQGQTIFQVAEKREASIVIVPDIQPSTDFQNLLKPTFDERTAELIGYGTINLNNQITDAKIYKYLSKHYDEKSEFWIAPNRLLFSYKFHQSDDKVWSIYLNQD